MGVDSGSVVASRAVRHQVEALSGLFVLRAARSVSRVELLLVAMTLGDSMLASCPDAAPRTHQG